MVDSPKPLTLHAHKTGPNPFKIAIALETLKIPYNVKKSEGASVLPGGFCAVDVHFWPWIDEYRVAGTNFEKYPLIKKWYDEVGQMDAVKAAYEKVPNGQLG